MCFVKTKGMNKTIAKEPIPTKKVVLLEVFGKEATIKSSIFGFVWWSGDIDNVPSDIRPKSHIELKVEYNNPFRCGIINEGYHSYMRIPHDVNYKTNKLLDDITNGKYVKDLVLIDAVIPEGAEFYINRIGEVVSSHLIIRPVITIIERPFFSYTLYSYPLDELFLSRLDALNK